MKQNPIHDQPDAAGFFEMNWRLILAAWAVGLPGVAAVAVSVLPGLLDTQALPVPAWVVILAGTAQSAGLLAVAALAGAALAPKVGLRAPVLSALAARQPLWAPLGPQLVPDVVGGLCGFALLALFAGSAPDAIRDLQHQLALPLAVRVLYGGVTEELLLRWGVMTVLVWLLWRYGQTGAGDPSPVLVWLAITASAVLFGAAHLPAASALVGELSAPVVLHVLLANTAFGLIAGYLYWRHGLESAMVAHASVHLASFVLGSG